MICESCFYYLFDKQHNRLFCKKEGQYIEEVNECENHCTSMEEYL